MPENVTAERGRLLALYGAKIVDRPASTGSNGAVAPRAAPRRARPALFMPFQYGNPANPRAHYEGTAAEIVALDRVDVFVAGLGTGGTLMGVGERLRSPSPTSYRGRGALPGRPGERPPLPGRTASCPPILDLSRLDRKLLVSNRDSIVASAPADEEGIFAGVSSGAVLHSPGASGRADGRIVASSRRRGLEVPLRRHLDGARRGRWKDHLWW